LKKSFEETQASLVKSNYLPNDESYSYFIFTERGIEKGKEGF
jgi:hypothetical protein